MGEGCRGAGIIALVELELLGETLEALEVVMDVAEILV